MMHSASNTGARNSRNSSPTARESNGLSGLKSKFESQTLKSHTSKMSFGKRNSSNQTTPSSAFHRSRQVFELDARRTRNSASSPISSFDRQTIKNRFNSGPKIEAKNGPNATIDSGATITNLNSAMNQINMSWINYKAHSSKCNIIVKKLRRGNKRSKSLPAKFNIDSLLDYLNTSMALNKYELKKLSQQRNLMLFMNNQQSNNLCTSSSGQLNSNPANNIYLSHLNRINTSRLGHSHHTSSSSGYNSSDNHSNSSATIPANHNTNFFNFYRLSLNHLPLNSILLNSQCTCGATTATTASTQPVSSSPRVRDQPSDSDFSCESEDELDELSADEELDAKPLCPSTSPQSPHTSDATTNTSCVHKPAAQRAPGTSHCLHTARVDIRRVRSLKDLSRTKLVYSENDFVFGEKLGEGFFANVRRIQFKQAKANQPQIVLKELKLNFVNLTDDKPESDPDSRSEPLNYAEMNSAHKSFLKEAQVLRNLSHPNVINMLGIMFTKEKHLNLILEYISGGTLKDIIHDINTPLQWKLRVGFARDIASAMQYLHSLNIIHRDLKSDNCLVRENGRSVVVADFGLSRIVQYSNSTGNSSRNNSALFVNECASFVAVAHTESPESSSATNSFIVAAKRKLKKRAINTHRRRYAVVGNSFSMAPEMLKHQIYDERVDIFSFGIICCEIIGRVQADPDYLPRTSDFGLNVELFRKKYCEPDCPKQFIKIAIACCELDPEHRPAFAKTHLWLNTILHHLQANNPIPKNLLKNILQQANAAGLPQLKL